MAELRGDDFSLRTIAMVIIAAKYCESFTEDSENHHQKNKKSPFFRDFLTTRLLGSFWFLAHFPC